MLIFAVLVLFNTQRLLSNAYKRLLKIGNKQHVYKRFQFLIGTFIRFTLLLVLVLGNSLVFIGALCSL